MEVQAYGGPRTGLPEVERSVKEERKIRYKLRTHGARPQMALVLKPALVATVKTASMAVVSMVASPATVASLEQARDSNGPMILFMPAIMDRVGGAQVGSKAKVTLTSPVTMVLMGRVEKAQVGLMPVMMIIMDRVKKGQVGWQRSR